MSTPVTVHYESLMICIWFTIIQFVPFVFPGLSYIYEGHDCGTAFILSKNFDVVVHLNRLLLFLISLIPYCRVGPGFLLVNNLMSKQATQRRGVLNGSPGGLLIVTIEPLLPFPLHIDSCLYWLCSVR